MAPHVTGSRHGRATDVRTLPVGRGLEIPGVAPKRNRRPNEHLLCSRLPNPLLATARRSSALPSPHHHHHHHQAMEFFPDGGFVRLQSRQNRKYIHADGDWEGVSLRPLGRVPSLEAVWRVEHWVSSRGHVFLLLQNAAYGRYLSLSLHPERLRSISRRVIQRDFDDPNLVDAFLWRWRAQRVDPDQDYVRLRQFSFHLRAHGSKLNWNTRLTGGLVRKRTLLKMMEWTVHAVAATPLPLPLPVTPPELPIQGGRRGRLFWDLWRHRGYGPGVYEDVPREIRYVRANNEGEFDQNHHNWLSFTTHDLPVVDLRMYLGNIQGDWTGDMLDFTLCIRPGSHGRLMPLVTHLPRSTDTLCIVVLRTGSPAAEALVYPQIYAPQHQHRRGVRDRNF